MQPNTDNLCRIDIESREAIRIDLGGETLTGGDGILLIVGFLSRLAALLLTINLIVAILLVKANVGFLPGAAVRARSSTWP